MSIRDLDCLFRPSSVAVVGASKRPGSVGSVLMRNLMQAGFDGPVMPVTRPRRPSSVTWSTAVTRASPSG